MTSPGKPQSPKSRSRGGGGGGQNKLQGTLISKESLLPGSYRQKDNILWDRQFQLKLLNVMHKGATTNGLNRLSGGRHSIQQEHKAIQQSTKIRGKAFARRHPPRKIIDALEARDVLMPQPALLAGQANTAQSGDQQAKQVHLWSQDELQLALAQYDQLIQAQASGATSNTAEAVFRSHFARCVVRFHLHQYMRALSDICKAIRLKPGTGTGYFVRGLVLRKLLCHEAALGDLSKAVSCDFNNMRMKKEYMRAIGLIERELGLFVEAGFQYTHLAHIRKRERKEQDQALARARRPSASPSSLSSRTVHKREASHGKARAKKGLAAAAAAASTANGGSAGQQDQKPPRTGKADTLKNGKKSAMRLLAKRKKPSFLSTVHQATGGKLLGTVISAKIKFMRSLLSPIVRIMVEAPAGKRSRSQLQRMLPLIRQYQSMSRMPDELLSEVCQHLEHESASAGSYIFHEGDPQDALYILISGIARVSVHRGGIDITVKTLLAGDTFGQINVMDASQKLARYDAAEEDEAATRRIEPDVSAEQASKEGKAKAGNRDDVAASATDAPRRRRNSTIYSRAWASDSLVSSNRRKASIYAPRHCEVLVLRHIQSNAARTRAIRMMQTHQLSERARILRTCHVVKSMPERQIMRLASIGDVHRFQIGTKLLRHGEPLKKVYILCRGVCNILYPKKGVVTQRAPQVVPPAGTGMLWQQQYRELLNSHSSRSARVDGKEQSEMQLIQIGTLCPGDLCGELTILNSAEQIGSPVEVRADTAVEALVFTVSELKPFIDHGMFSGKVRQALINSIGTNVPCYKKVRWSFMQQHAWNQQKSRIVRAHVTKLNVVD